MEDIKDITEKTDLYSTIEPHYYNAVSVFKSVKRALKRGHIHPLSGNILPRRPYNNRKLTLGRLSYRKNNIYGG